MADIIAVYNVDWAPTLNLGRSKVKSTEKLQVSPETVAKGGERAKEHILKENNEGS